MKVEEAVGRLQVIEANPDIERAHVDADQVLCDFLLSLGYADVVTRYHKISKYYA